MSKNQHTPRLRFNYATRQEITKLYKYRKMIRSIMESRILSKEKNQIILDEGNGYKIKATAKIVGTFAIVAIDWEHPNYGYFADAMLWYKSMHMFKWNVVPIVTWSLRYVKEENGTQKTLLEEFLKDYPELKELFDLEVSMLDNLSL